MSAHPDGKFGLISQTLLVGFPRGDVKVLVFPLDIAAVLTPASPTQNSPSFRYPLSGGVISS